LLASAGGVFALVNVEGEPCLLATAGDAPADMLPRLQSWVGKLLATAGVDVAGGEGAALGTRELSNGARSSSARTARPSRCSGAATMCSGCGLAPKRSSRPWP
jgi:hypothetical protein